MGELCVDFIIFGRNEEACEGINHEPIDLVHAVLEVKRPVRLEHVSVVQDHSLEDRPTVQPQLLTAFMQPLYQHFAHL